jgi:hypothetical protein
MITAATTMMFQISFHKSHRGTQNLRQIKGLSVKRKLFGLNQCLQQFSHISVSSLSLIQHCFLAGSQKIKASVKNRPNKAMQQIANANVTWNPSSARLLFHTTLLRVPRIIEPFKVDEKLEARWHGTVELAV